MLRTTEEIYAEVDRILQKAEYANVLMEDYLAQERFFMASAEREVRDRFLKNAQEADPCHLAPAWKDHRYWLFNK